MADEKVRNQARQSRAGASRSASNGEGTAGTPQNRRMREPLDESGAPLPGRAEAGAPNVIRTAGSTPAGQAKLGNAPIDLETSIEEEIRIKAYERYLARGREPGHAEEDWRAAEQEVRGKLWSRKDTEKK